MPCRPCRRDCARDTWRNRCHTASCLWPATLQRVLRDLLWRQLPAGSCIRRGGHLSLFAPTGRRQKEGFPLFPENVFCSKLDVEFLLSTHTSCFRSPVDLTTILYVRGTCRERSGVTGSPAVDHKDGPRARCRSLRVLNKPACTRRGAATPLWCGHITGVTPLSRSDYRSITNKSTVSWYCP